MTVYAQKKQKSKSKNFANTVSQLKSSANHASSIENNRAESVVQRKLQETADNSPRTIQLKALQDMLTKSSTKQTVQKKENHTNVAQLVKYKNVEYSVELNNISTFRDVANQDLAQLGKRDTSRDKKMLNIIAKSDNDIASKEELQQIIDPVGKGYQDSIADELDVINPEVTIIKDSANNAKAETFLSGDSKYDKDAAGLSNITVSSEMDEVIKSANIILSIVQWRKLDGIPRNANTIKSSAKNIFELFDKDGIITEKSQKVFPKKIDAIKRDSDSIINTADSIAPELVQSGDEQYLRGSVGLEADESGGSHLIIGKKLDTFKLEQTEKSSGILKASVWSGSVNDAFIEGGIDSNKEFRLVSDVPPKIERALKLGDFESFIGLAQEWGTAEKLKASEDQAKPQGDVEPVWWAIWDTRKDGLTTLSRELVKLMKAGYVLVTD